MLQTRKRADRIRNRLHAAARTWHELAEAEGLEQLQAALEEVRTAISELGELLEEELDKLANQELSELERFQAEEAVRKVTDGGALLDFELALADAVAILLRRRLEGPRLFSPEIAED